MILPNLSFTIGQFNITPFYFSLAIAFLISSFSFWRKLMDEDFLEENIFNLTVFLLISGISFSFIFKLAFQFPIVGSFWGVVLVMKWRIDILKRNLWDAFDALSLPLYYFILIGGVGKILSNWKLISFGYVLIGILGIFLVNILRKKFRSIGWYKSGRPGFVFWFSSLICFFALLLLDFLTDSKLYFKKPLIALSIIICFVIIYIRSGRIVKQDFGLIFKKRKKQGGI
jgi:hypothetical protein